LRQTPKGNADSIYRQRFSPSSLTLEQCGVAMFVQCYQQLRLLGEEEEAIVEMMIGHSCS
jgi:hypothetical protein